MTRNIKTELCLHIQFLQGATCIPKLGLSVHVFIHDNLEGLAMKLPETERSSVIISCDEIK
jgi:hypothetical protein